MMLWPFGGKSSGTFYLVQWRWFGPWYVRLINGDPVIAYHLDDIKSWATSSEDTDEPKGGWRYGA